MPCTRTRSADYEKNAFGILDALNSAPVSKPFIEDFGKRILADPQNNANGVIVWAHWLFAKSSMADATKALRPLLDSAPGRSTWFSLAADISDPNAARQWLDAATSSFNVAPVSATVLISQKTQLAESFKAVADRPNTPAALKENCLKSATALLEPMVSQNNSNQAMQTLLAFIYEDQENYAAASNLYRTMLKIQADNVIALNNLASNLAKMKKPGDAPEALKVIAQALALQSKVPTLYDTQASVYAVLAQDFPNALQSIQQAISLEPLNPNWRIGRIWILALSGQRATATTEFQQLKKDLRPSDVTPDSTQRLKGVGLE